MKKKFFIPAVLLTAVLILFPSCNDKNKKTDKEQMDRAAYYNDLINDTVNVSPKQLGLKLPDDAIMVYGVITEQNIANLLVVVSAAYSTGEAAEIVFGGNCFIIAGDNGLSSGVSQTLYDSAKKYLKYYEDDIEKYWKGESDLILSQNLLMTLFIEKYNEEIKNEIKKFIDLAQNYISSLPNANKDISLPEAGEIKIIFLTNKGKLVIKNSVDDIKTGRSEFLGLFKARSDISDIVFRNFAQVNSK